MQHIENIIFDLGGVLLNIDYNLTRTAFEELGVANFEEMYSQSGADELFKELERGTVSIPDFYKRLNVCTGLHLSAKEINNAWNQMLLDFREGSLRFVDSLKSRYRVFLLSNTNAIHMEAFFSIYESKDRKKLFRDYFERCFYSYLMGTRKPDVECYQQVISELNIIPGNTLFIDDSIQNLHGAEEAGLQTFFVEKDMLIEHSELKRLLL